MRLVEELRYAIRQLVHASGFTAAAVVTLALGIAGHTMFFAAVNAMVFRPIRAARTDDLFKVTFIHKAQSSGSLTAAQFRRLEADPPPGIARMGAIARSDLPVVVAIPGRAERVTAEAATAGYALALDLVPQAGRLLLPEDDVAGASRVAVVSDRLWRQWFRGDRSVIARTRVTMNAHPFTIVGVAPRGFRGLGGSPAGTADIWIAPTALDGLEERPGLHLWRQWLTFVRPHPSATSAQVETAIHTALTGRAGDPDPAFIVVRLSSAASFVGTDTLTSTGLAMLGLSSLLLIASCANLANMLFARGTQRAGEVAVRLALGASRLRIFTLFVLESTLISVVAAVLGLVLALTATAGIGAAFPSFRSRNVRLFVDFSPDSSVLLFGLCAGAAAALVVGTMTAWRATSVAPMRALASSSVATGSNRRNAAMRLGLVALQVMAAVLLLMGAGLFIRATEKALDRVLLFDTTPLATARVDLTMHGYHPAAGRIFLERTLRAVRALPGVDSAALADSFPVGEYSTPLVVDFRAEKAVMGKDGTVHRIEGASRAVRGGYTGASPGFLATLGVPLLRGRDISETDQDTTPLVAIINETAAGLLWPRQEPIGKRVMFGNDGKWRTIVGVARDPIAAKVESPLFSPANYMIIPSAQDYRPEMLIVIRSQRPAAQLEPLRRAVGTVDERVAVFDLATADESIMAWAGPMHAAAILTGLLGVLALTIASLGIYGVIAYLVGLRTREFGIRMALGAKPGQVVKIVLDDAIHLLLVGLLVGVFATATSERVLQSQRVGFMPNEISTWAAVLLLIVTVGVIAAFIPARRASRIEPMVALRDL